MPSDIFGRIAVIGGLILIGALLRRAQILRAEHAALLNILVMNLTLPATVFLAVLSLRNVRKSWLELLRVPLVAYLVAALCGLLAYILVRRLNLDRRRAGVFILLAMLGSTAFLGYPMKDALYRPGGEDPLPAACASCSEQKEICLDYREKHPQECSIYDEANATAVFYSELGTLIPLLTVAVVVASRYGEGERFSWRNLLAVLKSGPFVAFLIGLLFYTEEIPGVISGILGVLSQVTVPLIMLSLGITVRWGDFFGRQARAILAVNAVKLLLAPALALLFCLLLGVSGQMREVTILMSALPSLMLSLSYANQYRLDVEFASNALFASFFFSAITLPILVSLFPHGAAEAVQGALRSTPFIALFFSR
ncbi:MAG: AEC family transporter [Chloroflexia bacterium]